MKFKIKTTEGTWVGVGEAFGAKVLYYPRNEDGDMHRSAVIADVWEAIKGIKLASCYIELIHEGDDTNE